MKAAVFHGPGEMEVKEVDRPEVGPEEILIKLGANTVRGTDVRIVTGQKTSGVRRPSIIGHEFAGKIAQVGERVRGYEQRIPVAVAPTISATGATTASMGWRTSVALLSGAETVTVSQPSAPRREFAAGLGAHLTVSPAEEGLSSVVAEATGGIGVDAAIVCIGKPGLVNDALRLVRRGGSVNIFAGLSGEGWAGLEANRIHYDQLRVTGVSDCSRSDYEAALRLIRSGRVDVSRMVTHRFPLAEVNAALDSTASGEGIKAAVLP